MLTYALLFVTLMASSLSLFPAPETTVSADYIEGDIFIVPNALRYFGHNGYDNDYRLKNLGLNLQPQNVLVEIWATSRDDENNPMPGTWITAKEGAPTPAAAKQVKPENNWRAGGADTLQPQGNKSDNWTDHGHPQLGHYVFPRQLPLYLLEGKKEGDIVVLPIKNSKDEWVKTVLRCQQNGYRYGSHRYGYDFPMMLAALKKTFGEREDHGYDKFLIDKGILVRGKGSDRFSSDYFSYKHGPNGFNGTDKTPEEYANQNIAQGWLADAVQQPASYLEAVVATHKLYNTEEVHTAKPIEHLNWDIEKRQQEVARIEQGQREQREMQYINAKIEAMKQ